MPALRAVQLGTDRLRCSHRAASDRQSAAPFIHPGRCDWIVPVSNEVSRLRWQCRRGMRELDQLLVGYLERSYAGAGDDEKAAFQQLLTLPDPELASYFLGRELPEDAVIAKAVARILERT